MAYRLNRGLGGLSVSDLNAACGNSGSRGCDPHDSGCVAVSAAINDWAQNVYEASYPYGPDSAPPCPDVSNTAAITDAFMHNAPVSLGPQTGPGTSTPIPAMLGTGPGIAAQYATGPNGQTIISQQATPTGTLYIWSDRTQSTTTQYTGQPYAPASSAPSPAPSPAPTVAPVTQTTQPATTPQGQTIINSSGATQPAQTAAPSDNWFTDSMFLGIPNWGLVAAVGAALVLSMGGKH